jgi:hypothetical protein
MTALELSRDQATVLAQALCTSAVALVSSMGDATPPDTLTAAAADTILEAVVNNFGDEYPYLLRLRPLSQMLAVFVEHT